MLCANRQDDEHRCCSLGVVVPLIGRSGIINNVIIIYICATYNIYYVKKRCLKEKSVLYIVEESSFRGNRCVVSNTTNACGETERRSILCEGWNSSATNCYKGPRIRRGRSRMKRDNKPAAEKYKVRRQACTRVYIYIRMLHKREKSGVWRKIKIILFFLLQCNIQRSRTAPSSLLILFFSNNRVGRFWEGKKALARLSEH